MKWYFLVLSKYATFNGRARRTEFWMFILINFIISMSINIAEIVFMGFEEAQEAGIFSTLYSLAVFLPTLAAGVRRMHDQGKSGWFYIIPIYNIILAATKGDVGENEYGPDPKGGNADIKSDPEMGETLDGHLTV